MQDSAVRTRSLTRRCLRVLAVSLSVLSIARGARAQGAKIEAPRLLSLPEISLPADLTPPEDGRVEALITVAVDGSAKVDECDVAEAICTLIGDAIDAAHFEPARRDGDPVSVRIRIQLRLVSPPTAASAPVSPVTQPQPTAADSPTPASAPPTSTPPSAADSAAPTPQSQTPPSAANAPARERASTPPSAAASAPADDEPLYGARAHAHLVQPGSLRLVLAEMRDLPGAFGDPFRAVDALPGVVPVLSGLPYFFIRGSPPAGTLYVYDDIPVPTLFHLAVGPAVIHPLMVGPITLYAGVAPARYGRLTGGVIVGEGPAAGDGQTHVEAELRLLDASGYVQTNALGGTVTAAVRYGYPALLLSLFSPDVTLAYWDYQLRYDVDLDPRLHFELVTLGSYDSFGVSDQPGQAVSIQFHRFEPRLIYRKGKTEYGAALLFGWEESGLGSEFKLKATRIGPRLWWEEHFGERNRLRLSADMQGISGNFSSVVAPGDINRDTNDIGLVGNVRARSLWGVQAELGLRPWTALELQLGARADAWVQAGGAEAVIDPRLRVILHASDKLDFHIAAGVVHQPAVFFLPLPGISDLANDKGLQTALQSEAGVGWDSPFDLRVELQLFLHRYENLVFTDALLLGDTIERLCDSAKTGLDCGGYTTPKRINGLSYGFELFLRRPITERLSGFVSYTLAFSTVDNIAGLHYTPSWDVRHVANLVLQWQIGAGFSAGLRWFVRSGKSAGEYEPDFAQLTRIEQRLPWFTRLDLETAYAWPTSWGRMRVALEWFNVTMSREPEDSACSGLPLSCHTVYLPAIFFPNLSVRGEH
jgi:hypothetical protein